MAINAYTGLMGSGKSYEVVASVVLPAIKSGRDVVTNIRGLNQALIYEYLVQPDEGRAFGKIRQVKNDQIQDEDFFPQFVDEKFVLNDKTIVQPGDIVCIDEAWRPWGTDSKCIKAHMSFFREHRQCADSQGNSCDLVIITQDITDIHKLLKNVIELSFLFTKLKTLGLSKRYRVEVYEGSKLYKSKRTSWTTQTYNKKIFPLYKSYANDSGQGAEKVIDSRQNFLKSGAFLVPLVIAVVLIASGTLALKHFFDPGRFAKSKPDDKAIEATTTAPTAPGSPAAVSSSAPGAPAMPSSMSSSGVSIAGSVTIGNDKWVVLSGPQGLHIVSPSMVRSRGVSAVTLDEFKASPAYLSK
jgi:zona occludens toxin